MSLKNILEKIQLDAERKGKDIIGKAEEETKKILSKATQDGKEKSDRIIDEATQSARQKDKRMILAAELAARKDILSEKQKSIQNCFKGAMEKLNHLSDQDYRDIVKNMLMATYNPEITEVIFSEKDSRRIDQQFIDKVNRTLEEKGEKGQLRLSQEKREISGGFILKGDRVEINNSFASVLKYRQNDLEADVAKIIFGES